MGAVPAAMPDTRPLVDTTVATPVAPLVQVPPGVASDSGVVELTHTLSVPLIATGEVFTVTTRVTLQPNADV